jgi:leucyl aminopeptidase
MQIVWSRDAPESVTAPLLAVPLFELDGDPRWRRLLRATGKGLARLAREEGFEARRGQQLLVSSLAPGGGLQATRLLLLGAQAVDVRPEVALAEASAQAARWAADHGLGRWALWVPALPGLSTARLARRAATGALAGAYRPTRRTPGPGGARCSLVWTGPASPDVPAALGWARAAGRGLTLARDLVNAPPNLLTPALFARRARAEARARGIEVEVWGPARLARERCRLHLAVARGSAEPPRLVWLRYRPRRGRSRGHLALVGKGVTFDAGGLALKPQASQLEMKADMAGAAVVLGLLCAAARLALPWTLTGLLPLSENMPDGRAMRTGDVLRSRSGKTVELHHPDAEGRLLLADALDLARGLRPDRLVDLATLTGACKAALGPWVAGLFGTDEVWAGELEAAAARVGEGMWRLPLHPSLASSLRSDSADVRNAGARFGGAIAAALFLKEFVGDTPWLHVDMAGPAFLDREHGLHPRGGTGFGLLSLLELLAPAP